MATILLVEDDTSMRLLTTAKQILLSEVMLVESVDEQKSEAWLEQFI